MSVTQTGGCGSETGIRDTLNGTMRWTVHGERVIYDSEWIRLALADVELPSGKRFEHHVVRMPYEAAGTVVDDPDRGVLLLWRHRFTTDTWGWEIPAGRVDEGETPAEAATRETVEEAGWRPGPLTLMTTYYPHNGIVGLDVPPVRRHVRGVRRGTDRRRRGRTRRVARRGPTCSTRSAPATSATGCR